MPAYCSTGVRHEGGVTLIQALARNVGTCRPDAKGEAQADSIRYVSPAQRHAGEDQAILAARQVLYTSARDLNPARWSGKTRNWTPVGPVTLNPERDCIVKSQSPGNSIQPLAA